MSEHAMARTGRQARVTLREALTAADVPMLQPVLVSSANGREVGLLGAMSVDVVETRAVIDQATYRQKGIAGAAIIRERTSCVPFSIRRKRSE